MYGGKSQIVALLVLVVIVLLVVWAYDTCKLNKFLAVKHQKVCTPTTGNFVGAMAVDPHLVACKFPTSPNWSLNRCNYV